LLKQTIVHKFRRNFKAWRKKQWGRLPYVKRRRYDKAVRVLEEFRIVKAALARTLLLPSDALAAKASIIEAIPVNRSQVDELCLFVTHAPTPNLKQHVIDHVNALIDADIAVVLIVNTDHRADEFLLRQDFSSRLRGLLIRQNIGFDFGAWGHAVFLLPHGMARRRLYLVNDSLVGPLDQAAYATILERIRKSSADMIGLTHNAKPIPHLQSFYMVFGERLFRSTIFLNVMTNLLNLPSKEAAVDVYELQLTGYFQEHGFRCEALFPSMAQSGHSNDTIFRWARLIEAGFPFIKASVLQNNAEAADVIRLVPGKYRLFPR
jgi:lipopolysaccharide biosynthesis protein